MKKNKEVKAAKAPKEHPDLPRIRQEVTHSWYFRASVSNPKKKEA